MKIIVNTQPIEHGREGGWGREGERKKERERERERESGSQLQYPIAIGLCLDVRKYLYIDIQLYSICF